MQYFNFKFGISLGQYADDAHAVYLMSFLPTSVSWSHASVPYIACFVITG